MYCPFFLNLQNDGLAKAKFPVGGAVCDHRVSATVYFSKQNMISVLKENIFSHLHLHLF
jgi:hypothetical protein